MIFPAAFALADGEDALADGAEATSVSLGADISLTVGDTVRLPTQILPAEAADTALSWSSGNEACAAVDGSGNVTAIAAGQAEITVAVAADSSISDTLVVTVTEPISDAPATDNSTIEVTGVAVTDEDGFDEDVAVAVGGTLQLIAAVSPTDATEQGVTWSLISGEAYAALEPDTPGLLTGVAEGLVTVRATAADDSGAYGELTVAVIDPNAVSTLAIDVAGVTVTAAGGIEAVAVGHTLQLSAEVLPSDADDTSVTWSLVSGAEYAALDAATPGLMSAIAAGSVTVRATSVAAPAIYGDITLEVRPAYDYVLVVNTNPDPTQEQSTGVLNFDGGSASQSSRSNQSYSPGDYVQLGRTVSGYAVGDAKTIGYTDYVCIGVGAHCFIWMERSLWAAYDGLDLVDTAAAEMMALYEGRPYQALTTLAGGEIPTMDGTGKLSILLEQISGSTGYYAGEDYITAIHIQTPAAADYTFGDLSGYAGLLAHEGQHALFQHLVCADNAGAEQPLRWINEGLSVAVMDWVWGGDGNGSRGWLTTVTGNSRIRGGESLAYANYRNDSGLDYGLPYLFVRYLCDQAAHKYDPLPHLAKFYRAYTGSTTAYLNAVLSSLGVSGSATFADALKNFYVAAVAQDGSGVNGFYGDPVVKTRMTYPIFDGASGLSYTLPGTGAIVLRTADGLFTQPAGGVGADIAFVPFNMGDPTSAWGGGGTADNPYLVDSDSILSAIALNPSGYYKLTDDIDVTGTVIPIDTFTGTLNGNGHTIRGLSNSLIYENRGTVCNLNVVLAMNGSYGGYTGGVVCHNYGTVRNVNVTGTFGGSITGTNPYGYPVVGALVGCSEGDIHECEADVAMSFSTLPANHVYLGQIAGKSQGQIYDCIAAGSISATQSASGAYDLFAGGLVGWLESSFFVSSLQWSYSLTGISVQDAGGNVQVGRLVGCESKTGAYSSLVTSCYGLEGLSAVGSTQTASATLSGTACLRTSEQLKTQSNYAGWDFTGVWSIAENEYPSFGAAAAVTLTASARRDYFVGEKLDLTGATVTAGSVTVPMTAGMLYSLPDFDTPGDYTVLGEYDAAPFSFPVTVTQPADVQVTGLTLVTAAKIDYLAGQRFDPSGAVLRATIGGKPVTIVSGFTLSNTAALTEADTEITYTYCGQTATQAVRVAARAVVSVVRTAVMTKTEFSDGEALSLAGLTLRLTYSDGTQINGVTAAQLGQYGLMLLRVANGTPGSYSATRTLSGTDDDGAELYICLCDSVPASLTGRIYCYVATLSVGNVAYMPDQTLAMHVGFRAADDDEYVYSDAVEGGSGGYSTTLVGGTLPAGITSIVPGGGYESFIYYGKAQTQFDVSLRYLVRDTYQNQQFYVTIRLMAVPLSDECDIIEMSLGGVPCTISGNTVSVVLPQGRSLTGLLLNAALSPGAKQNWINGMLMDCSTDQTITVYAQSNLNNELLPGKHKVYTVRASVATDSALGTPTGISRSVAIVTWDAVANADSYLVTLMHRIAGTEAYESLATYTVTETRFDMWPVIPRTGRYYVTVRAADSTGEHPASPAASTAGDVYYCNRVSVDTITVSGPERVIAGRTGSYTAAVLPADAGNTAVRWTVEAGSGTADITQAGVLTAGTVGTVTVKAAAEDGSGTVGSYAVTIVAADPLRTVSVDVSGVDKPSEVLWIDGVPYSGSDLTISGSQYSVMLADTTATNAVVYSYNSLTETDPHKVYPTNMTVWLLTYGSGGYVAQRAPDFDNLLRYAGSSIRITGTKGIRMITSLATAAKTALTGSGLSGYTLLEYGTVVAWKDELGPQPLLLGKSYVKSAYAYKKNVGDPIYKQAGGLTQYTNVLVGFDNEKCRPDLVLRPYIKLVSAAGDELTLYGGAIERSIGYIAYQNRSAFTPGTAAYSYIWSIIHYVYQDEYDADYRG